jgi:hypothetical protein
MTRPTRAVWHAMACPGGWLPWELMQTPENTTPAEAHMVARSWCRRSALPIYSPSALTTAASRSGPRPWPTTTTCRPTRTDQPSHHHHQGPADRWAHHPYRASTP